MYPNETAEHHRDHRCRNKEVNQFCYDPISKYRGNFCGCITGHHPVWAASRSWVSRHLSLSLHLSIRGDKVWVRSCLIFRYRIWPKKQCILEKHSNFLQKYNSCRLLLTITHKYLSSHETRKHRHIFARVAAFWQRVFQTLPNLDVHPGVAVYHTLKIFSIVNAKDLLMPHTKFQVCTLKRNTIFCHRQKKSHYFWTGLYILYILYILLIFGLHHHQNKYPILHCHACAHLSTHGTRSFAGMIPTRFATDMQWSDVFDLPRQRFDSISNHNTNGSFPHWWYFPYHRKRQVLYFNPSSADSTQTKHGILIWSPLCLHVSQHQAGLAVSWRNVDCKSYRIIINVCFSIDCFDNVFAEMRALLKISDEISRNF